VQITGGWKNAPNILSPPELNCPPRDSFFLTDKLAWMICSSSVSIKGGKSTCSNQSSPEQPDHLTSQILKMLGWLTKIGRGWSRAPVFPVKSVCWQTLSPLRKVKLTENRTLSEVEASLLSGVYILRLRSGSSWSYFSEQTQHLKSNNRTVIQFTGNLPFK